MGCYEEEQELIAQGLAQRGHAARAYWQQLDEQASDLTRHRRPDYSQSLFAPANDDIYRELCAFIDMPEPRFLDAIENPLRIEGYTAADVYAAMMSNNWKLRELDAVAVYNMLAMLRDKPAMAKRVLAFRPRCDKAGAC